MVKIDKKDLEYIFNNNPYEIKNIYPKDIIKNLPDIHLQYLKKNNIKYRFNPAPHRYQRSIDILRLDETVITTIDPPKYLTNSIFSSTIVRDKFKTENYLRDFSIRTPNSSVYDKDDVQKARENVFNEHSERIVVKPLHGSLGKGVMVNVSEKRFFQNWDNAVKHLHGSRQILVQDYLPGFEARATVIEGKLVAVTVRTPPYVIGDGVLTIDQLIDLSNEEKKKCGVRKNLLIKKHDIMKEFLISNNISLSYKPKNDEFVLLGSVSNVVNGGELLDITDFVSEEVKNTAMNTIGAFHGMFTGGVDIMMKSFDEKEPVVLEVNAFPVLSITAFPTYGNQKNPSKIYIESVIARDQFLNNQKEKYEIENVKEYLQYYLKFIERKNKLFNKNYKNHSKKY